MGEALRETFSSISAIATWMAKVDSQLMIFSSYRFQKFSSIEKIQVWREVGRQRGPFSRAWSIQRSLSATIIWAPSEIRIQYYDIPIKFLQREKLFKYLCTINGSHTNIYFLKGGA